MSAGSARSTPAQGTASAASNRTGASSSSPTAASARDPLDGNPAGALSVGRRARRRLRTPRLLVDPRESAALYGLSPRLKRPLPLPPHFANAPCRASAAPAPRCRPSACVQPEARASCGRPPGRRNDTGPGCCVVRDIPKARANADTFANPRSLSTPWARRRPRRRVGTNRAALCYSVETSPKKTTQNTEKFHDAIGSALSATPYELD